MPQNIQHTLLNVVLLWTTILSIFQIVCITLLFTARPQGQSQNSITVTPERTTQIQANNTPSQFSTEHGLLLGKGKMLTFQAVDDNEAPDGKVYTPTWVAKNPDTSLISENGKVLTIRKDGYYFLNLQVTLCSEKKNHTVSVKWNEKFMLQGLITTESCSTCLLSRAAELFAGGTLEVTINPKTYINTSEALTHLNIIYMVKP